MTGGGKMVNQHEISEYIENLPLQKTFCKGYRPNDVQEVISNLSSMYDQLLSTTLLENEELKKKLECLEKVNLVADFKEDVKEACVSLEDANEAQENIHFMTDKELQRLKRRELLEILLEQSKEKDTLSMQLNEKDRMIKELQLKLAIRKIDLEKVGTLAEASFVLNGVLEAADKAAQQYLENIQNLHEKEKSLFEVKKEEVEASCKTKIKETEKRSKELLEMTKEICDERKKETEEKCQCLEQKAKEEVEKKWNDLSGRLEEFYESHQGLRELLSSGKMI